MNADGTKIAWISSTVSTERMRPTQPEEMEATVECKTIEAVDPEIARAVAQERNRQETNLELIASENTTSPAVMGNIFKSSAPTIFFLPNRRISFALLFTKTIFPWSSVTRMPWLLYWSICSKSGLVIAEGSRFKGSGFKGSEVRGSGFEGSRIRDTEV